jgi:ABC-type uncharacterized transport system YnjBCD ATPase subunit
MGSLEALEQRVRQARYTYERRTGAARQLGQDGMRVKAEVESLRAETERHAKVNALLTSLGETAQANAQEQLEQLVTRGLQVIFGSELSFHVVQTVKANQAFTDFVIRSTYEGNVMLDTPVLEARGGGMAAVVGFMVRLVVLLLTPGARRILFLDETFGHLSREYEARLAEFIAEVARRAQVQIFLVTHSDGYDDYADARIRLAPDREGRAQQA